MPTDDELCFWFFSFKTTHKDETSWQLTGRWFNELEMSMKLFGGNTLAIDGEVMVNTTDPAQYFDELRLVSLAYISEIARSN